MKRGQTPPVEIYCDESHPDGLTSSNPLSSHLFLGALWLAPGTRDLLKQVLSEIKSKHSYSRELKWNRISPRTLPVYLDVVDTFFKFSDLRFRAVAVPLADIRYDYNSDREHRFYVFFEQLLTPLVDASSVPVQIFLDSKTLRDTSRPNTLRTRLEVLSPHAMILPLQSVNSDESLCTQLTDVLLGCVQARLNKKIEYQVRSEAKRTVVAHLEDCLGREVGPTPRGARKFNVFKMDRLG